MTTTPVRSGGDSDDRHGPALTPRSGRVKEARKLQRRAVRSERCLFLAEGAKSLAEALEVPGCVREVFASEAAYEDPATADLLVRCAAAGVDVRRCEATVIEALADTVSPQGVVAVCAEISPEVSAEDLQIRLQHARLVVVCADVRDPGNAGAVIRCADAAGADAVVLAGFSVDPHNPKTVRATVGSLFHLPVLRVAGGVGGVGGAVEAVDAVRRAGLQVLAADGGGEVDLDEAADDGLLARRTAWLMGNEAWGLPPELAGQADARVAIPIHGRAESLNLAAAAAVCLYASARALRRRTVPE